MSAALFPGCVYQHAVFPISLFCLLATSSLHCAQTRRWLAAGALGFLTAMTYTTGVLIAAPLGLAALLLSDTSTPLKGRLLAAGVAGGLSAAGFGAVLLTHWIAVGHWNAMFQVAAKYGVGMHSPLQTWVDTVGPLFRDRWDGARSVVAAQTFVVAALFIPAMVAAAVRGGWRRRPELVLAIFALTYWLFPLVMGEGVSLYRAEATLVPSIALLKDAPEWLVGLLLGVFVALAFPMSALFFLNYLV